MDDDVKYTQNDDGSRSYNFTLTQEQIAGDQFLGAMKDGADLLKSWQNQKGLIGAKSIPNADAPEDDWKRIYEKARPADGKYGLTDETLEKFASDNGLNKYQAGRFAEFVAKMKEPDPNNTGSENLAQRLNAEWGEKTGEKVTMINALMKQAWSETENQEFEKLPNSVQVMVAKALDSALAKFGVKGADFQIGIGAQPAGAPKRDWDGYEKEKREMMKDGNFSDLQDKALRQKYNIGYINLANAIK